MPDGVGKRYAAEELIKKRLVVIAYCHADPVLCKRLESGCQWCDARWVTHWYLYYWALASRPFLESHY